MNAKPISLLLIISFSFLMNFFPAYGEDSLYEIQGKKITYEDDKNLIIASGNAYAKDQQGKEIFSDKITYNKKKFIRNEKKIINNNEIGLAFIDPN